MKKTVRYVTEEKADSRSLSAVMEVSEDQQSISVYAHTYDTGKNDMCAVVFVPLGEILEILGIQKEDL